MCEQLWKCHNDEDNEQKKHDQIEKNWPLKVEAGLTVWSNLIQVPSYTKLQCWLSTTLSLGSINISQDTVTYNNREDHV